MTKQTRIIPMNLQLFADDAESADTSSESQTSESNVDQSADDNQPKIEDLMAEIAKLKADGAKQKNALDKALKEKGDLTKSLRARQTAEEQEAEARKEQEEERQGYIKSLEDYKAKNEAVKRYLMQEMDADTAEKCAEAEIAGDMDTLSDLQKKFREKSIKAAQAAWLKTRPQPQAGGENNAPSKEDFDKMDITQKSKLYRENKAEYDRLSKL